MQILSPSESWSDYRLIDSGCFEKLERFGRVVVRRPEPKAVWNRSLPEKEWAAAADVSFTTGAGFGKSGREDSGAWTAKRRLPENWQITYRYRDLNLRLEAALTSFKHVGVFPEQAPNWNYIYDSVKQLNLHQPKVLNLFAYTGAATLAARAAGADVVHLDSVRQVVSWARRNMEASAMSDVRWVVDDAMKFVVREARRGNRYSGVILDPPAYGHGTNGERWKLDDNIGEMMNACKAILSPENSFLVLNLYSNGFSALVADTLVSTVFGKCREKTFGELVLEDSFAKRLPLSVFSRIKL